MNETFKYEDILHILQDCKSERVRMNQQELEKERMRSALNVLPPQ